MRRMRRHESTRVGYMQDHLSSCRLSTRTSRHELEDDKTCEQKFAVESSPERLKADAGIHQQDIEVLTLKSQEAL